MVNEVIIMYVKIVTPVGKMDLNMSLENTRKLLSFACNSALPEKETREDVAVKLEKPVKAEENAQGVIISNLISTIVDTTVDEKEEIPVEAEAAPPAKIQPKRGHKGFLLIKCPECGEIKGFCRKEPITEYRCPCGAATPLEEDLTAAYLRCQCGSTWKYRTNITDEVIEYNCLNCGCPVDMAYNKKKGIYETIK